MKVNQKQGANLLNKKKNAPHGPLYPYKPHTDRGFGHEFSEYDVLWSTSLLTQPGKQGCFLVYKYDQ